MRLYSQGRYNITTDKAMPPTSSIIFSGNNYDASDGSVVPCWIPFETVFKSPSEIHEVLDQLAESGNCQTMAIMQSTTRAKAAETMMYQWVLFSFAAVIFSMGIIVWDLGTTFFEPLNNIAKDPEPSLRP